MGRPSTIMGGYLPSEFPASWENTGNSSDSGLGDAKLPAKNLKESMTSKQNSLRHGTGN
jgi:hypothetical protein